MKAWWRSQLIRSLFTICWI